MMAKAVRESSVTMSHMMMPQDANPAGIIHGGVVMKHIDDAAGVVALRHTRSVCVTASIDRIDFYNPVYIGDLLTLKASLNMVGHTSMEIGVRVESENLISGKITHTSSAYLTFVALGGNSKPKKIPSLLLESQSEIRRNKQAVSRRKIRLAEKKQEKECREDTDQCDD
jgi:acyl-CoA hydrolase